MSDEPTVTVELTQEEIKALLAGLDYVNVYYTLPNPPSPGMTAAEKLREVARPAPPNEERDGAR